MVPTNVQITIDSTTIHIAFNPILPGGETVEISNLNILFPAFNPESGIDPETVNRIVEQTFRSTFIGIIGIGSVALATSWLGIPGAVASLAVYSAGIIGIIAYARLLLDAGEKTKALSTLVSTCVSTALSALGAFLGAAFLEKTVFIVKAIAAPILASFLANLVNPAPLADAIIVAMMGLTAGILVSLTVRRLGDPTTSWWLPAFICLNFIFAYTSNTLYKEWLNY